MDNKKWYTKNIWIIISLIIFFPLGLFLTWTNKKWHKNVKIGVTVAIVALMLLGSRSFVVAKNATTQNDLVAAQTDAISAKQQHIETSSVNTNAVDASTADVADASTAPVKKVTKQKYLATYLDYYNQISDKIKDLAAQALVYGVDSIQDEWTMYRLTVNLVIPCIPTTDENLTVLQKELPYNLIQLVELFDKSLKGDTSTAEAVALCDTKIQTALGLI